jgi:hypothetical protein
MSTLRARLALAWSALWGVTSDPQAELEQMPINDRRLSYSQSWNYYRGDQFSTRKGQDWSLYLASRELYKNTRLIYNPTTQIVDFYVDNLWQPAQDEAHESLVTPVSDSTDEALKAAIAQIDQWSVFQSEAPKIKRYGAATGNVLIEGVDDLVRQKVLHNTVWPGYVIDLQLNDTGDVQSYALEYDVIEDAKTNKRYRYKKIVDKETIRHFRNDSPWTPPGTSGSVEELPYGFCFAVWIRHTDDGSDFGLPACKDLNKIDEMNSLASHLHDNIHKLVESPVVLSVDGEVIPIVGASSRTLPDGTNEIVPQDPRLNWIVLKAKPGASVLDLASKLKLAEAHPYLKDLLASFTDDYPELQAATIIQQNSQLSGAALERMLTPAQNRLDGVQGNWNQQLIKLRQMQIAVAGMRFHGNDWSFRTKQQANFAPYSLDSYNAGTLDFNLKKSVLVRTTEAEDEELLKAKTDRANALMDIGIDELEALQVAGYSEEDAKKILARSAQNEPTDDPDVLAARGLPNEGQTIEQIQ